MIVSITSYGLSVFATTATEAMEQTLQVASKAKIYDYAELLTEDDENVLYDDINEFIDNYDMDMVIVTINVNDKGSPMEYADDFYDYNDFGIGEDRRGLLFLIDMQNRQMWISTTGSAIQMYTDARIDKILDYTYDKISEQDYYGCVSEFIKYAGIFASQGANGSTSVMTREGAIKLEIGASVLVTIIFVCIGVANHINVHKRSLAKEYISKGLKLHEGRDNFVSRHVSKTPRESSSSGGSSTHTSSSGSSHGGGGRGF